MNALLLWGLLLVPALGGALAWAAEPLAEVNGDPITVEELERSLGPRLQQLQDQIHALKRRELEALIAERLLAQEAARRGLSVAALLDAEVTSKVPLVSEQEIEAFHQANRPRLRGEETELRQRIRSHLQQQKLTVRRAQFVEELRARATVVVRLSAPPVRRVAVSVDGAPVRGAADARVTVVEFSDFHCPFCRRVQTTLKELLARYPGQVRLVFRDLPIDALHPRARRAAEAARCAHDQGRFWEYHDLLFEHAPRAAPEDLRRYAEQAALDVPAFERCLSAGGHREAVQRDIDEAARLGIEGTPAFFINGRHLQGAQPLEAFVRMIEEELAGQ